MSVLLEQSKCTNITVVGASGKNMIPIIKRITGIQYNADDWNSLQTGMVLLRSQVVNLSCVEPSLCWS